MKTKKIETKNINKSIVLAVKYNKFILKIICITIFIIVKEVPKDWKDKPFNKEDNPNGGLYLLKVHLLLYFQNISEKYLSDAWPLVQQKLESIST
jgi:hypothetical protein